MFACFCSKKQKPSEYYIEERNYESEKILIDNNRLKLVYDGKIVVESGGFPEPIKHARFFTIDTLRFVVVILPREMIVLTQENLDEIKTIHLENPISFEETDISLSNDKQNDLKVTNNDMSFLKNVAMPDFENSENVEDLQSSYKKMTINKLREVIVSKGVVSDASKLKKNEILKMLDLD